MLYMVFIILPRQRRTVFDRLLSFFNGIFQNSDLSLRLVKIYSPPCFYTYGISPWLMKCYGKFNLNLLRRAMDVFQMSLKIRNLSSCSTIIEHCHFLHNFNKIFVLTSIMFLIEEKKFPRSGSISNDTDPHHWAIQ